MTGESQALALALAPGSIVDKLRIDRVLGQGAFGITYLVTDEVLGKSFALKEYLPREHAIRQADGSLQAANGTSAEVFTKGLSYFLTEGRTVAPLDHPNIVTVFRCFEANGTAYLLMPYYRGEALDTLLRRSGTLTAAEALALTLPLLDALEYIHRQGVIHQDIKPANIYITDSGSPILLDFGAAGQWLGSGPANRWKLGSEGYAAAEQSDANGRIGPWTDIYGLAATLYRSITGQVPVAATQRQRALAQGDPDPLQPLSSLVSEREFEALLDGIKQGLVVNPEARPQSVQPWRSLFDQSKPGQQSATAGFPTDIEREGREWLPIILLGIFLVAVTSAAIYLFTGSGTGDASGKAGKSSESVFSEEVDRFLEDRTRWQAALEADTAYAYQLFLQDFPQSLHKTQAKAQLDVLDEKAWQVAQADGSESAIEAYLEQFPGGLHLSDATIAQKEFELARAEAQRQAQRQAQEKDHQDDLAWDSARAARTIGAMEAYLSDWPGGRHGEDARDLSRRLRDEINELRGFESAAKLNTIEAYQTYIRAFPGGSKIAAALEAIDQLTLRPGKTFRDCADCPAMVVVPAGSFWQGSEESEPLALKKEKPRRMITFAEPFAVGVFEVTMQQWDLCAADGDCTTRPRDNGWGRGSRPVIMVSWNDAQEYVSWLSKKTGQSYRLPSESEWEYFARAGEESDWPGGDPALACEFGNIAGFETGFRWQHEFCEDGAVMETLPVGSFKSNDFGIYDVIGNVAEWTLDCMNLSYLDGPADGSAWSRGICSSRMTRGGSWFTGTKEIRLPARFNLKTGDRNDFTGFRVVRKVDD
ncbi:MAG: bifunctional serine/threonine-protein kinase/formylglycine-generating enzyme family protein [Xanthomonadales bacterium]